MAFIDYYYKFQKLSPELQYHNNISSSCRYDCVSSTDTLQVLSSFQNTEGKLFVYKRPANYFMRQIHERRLPKEVILNNKGFMTGFFLMSSDETNIGYGHSKLLYPDSFKNDGFLIIDSDKECNLELFGITNGKGFIKAYFQKLLDGNLNHEFETMRAKAEPYFDYEKSKSLYSKSETLLKNDNNKKNKNYENPRIEWTQYT